MTQVLFTWTAAGLGCATAWLYSMQVMIRFFLASTSKPGDPGTSVTATSSPPGVRQIAFRSFGASTCSYPSWTSSVRVTRWSTGDEKLTAPSAPVTPVCGLTFDGLAWNVQPGAGTAAA